MGKIIEELRQKHNLSENSIKILEENFTTLAVKRGEFIMLNKQTNRNLYLVDSGLMKCCFFREDKERIMHFAFEGDMAMWATNNQSESTLTLEAIEDTVLFRLDADILEKLIVEYPEIALWAYRQLETIIEITEYLYLNFGWMDKQSQYKKTMDDHPDVFQRIPLKDIASFLNITQSSLSRIRAKVEL